MSSDEKLDEILRRIGLLETGVQNIGTRLETVEGESVAIKQGIVNLGIRVESVEIHQVSFLLPLQESLASLHAETEKGFRRLEQKIDLLHKDIFELRTDHKLLESRVDDLERKAS